MDLQKIGTTETRELLIPRALSDLERQVEKLESQINGLTERLVDCLSILEPNEKDLLATEDPSPPMCRQINSVIYRLKVLGSRVDDLVQRLEL